MSTPQPSTSGAVSLHTIILAAGLGRRLWPLTRDCPKPLVDLGDGRTILGSQIDVLAHSPSVTGVTVVAGHLAEQLEDFAARHGEGRVGVRFNPFFDVAGPLGSIWAVRDLLLDRDFVLINGDTVFDEDVLEAVATRCAGGGLFLVGSHCDEFGPDDVRIDEVNGVIRRVGKGLSAGEARSSGMLVAVGQSARRAAAEYLDAIVRDQNALSGPWHGWVDRMAAELTVEVILVEDRHWSEVDVHPELEDLRSELASRLR